eukprot:5684045-Pyramimonas_sp.AAC.1
MAPRAAGERALFRPRLRMREDSRSGHQSHKGRANIPVAGTSRRRGERIYPERAPITEGEHH